MKLAIMTGVVALLLETLDALGPFMAPISPADWATQPAIDAPRDVAVVVADAPPPPDAMPDAMPDAPIDAAAPAPVPVDPARELRAQLREANAKKDWDRAVLLGRKLSHIGQLDKESDKLSTEGSYKINDEMRPSIERLIQSGDCANARTRFDAMVKRSDLHDQPLYKKLQACGGEVTMDDVLLHANKGEYDEALAAAEQILAKDPRDERARRYAVVAACMAKNPAKAQALYDKLTDPKRKEDAKGICSARGIEVK